MASPVEGTDGRRIPHVNGASVGGVRQGVRSRGGSGGYPSALGHKGVEGRSPPLPPSGVRYRSPLHPQGTGRDEGVESREEGTTAGARGSGSNTRGHKEGHAPVELGDTLAAALKQYRSGKNG